MKIDKWLSSQLGYTAYNLNSKNVKNIDFFKYQHDNILISIKSDQKFQSSFLKKNKIKLIEKNITFFKSLKKEKFIDSNFKNIRFANNFDKELILDIAEKSFINSRFFKDKKIKNKFAKKIKRNWVLNFFNKKRGEYLIVSEFNKKVVGFLLILRNSNNNYIIDLIAVKKKYQNLGFGSKMIKFFENVILMKNKRNKIYVSTQFKNKNSIKLYIKNKFKVKYKKYIYHFNGY